MYRNLIATILLLACVSLQGQDFLKVACIGDSVTYGEGIADKDSDSYPSQLGVLLGNGYEVRNFGHNGATLLSKGHRPFITLPEFGKALEYKPDIVVIHLGLNDTDPRNWPDWQEEFIPDYRALIDTFRIVNPSVRIWICKMTPIMSGHHRFLSGTRDWHAQVQRCIEKIAATADVGLVDLYSPLFTRPELFADNLHPDAEGAGIIASAVYSAITGDFGGLKPSPIYGDNMVVQRERPIVFRGIADKGDKVKVSFAGKKTSVLTGSDGHWEAVFPPMSCGGPYKLEISTKDRKFGYSGIWIGEVWVCSGQSNMAFKLQSCRTGAEDLAEAAGRERVHLFDMEENWLTNDYAWPRSALDSVNRLLYFRPTGWRKSSRESAAGFSAIGYHFARTLADSLGCHIGIIDCSVGGSTTESWVDRELLRNEFPEILHDWNHGDFGQPWARERTLHNISLAVNPLQRHPYQPGYLFDAGIRALDKFTIRGILWYQGESNAHNTEAHEKLFPLMVRGWRGYWGYDIPVQTIQLSGIGDRPSWPRFRDSQRLLAETVPNVGLTVCSDLGHPSDVHPRAKKEVGERSAACVLHNVYGHSSTIPAGPRFLGMTRDGNRLILSFGNSRGMSVTRGFEVAASDGIFKEASCLVEGDCVTVWSDAVACPEEVRYAWKANPAEADFCNAAGFPASTFHAILSRP